MPSVGPYSGGLIDMAAAAGAAQGKAQAGPSGPWGAIGQVAGSLLQGQREKQTRERKVAYNTKVLDQLKTTNPELANDPDFAIVQAFALGGDDLGEGLKLFHQVKQRKNDAAALQTYREKQLGMSGARLDEARASRDQRGDLARERLYGGTDPGTGEDVPGSLETAAKRADQTGRHQTAMEELGGARLEETKRANVARESKPAAGKTGEDYDLSQAEFDLKRHDKEVQSARQFMYWTMDPFNDASLEDKAEAVRGYKEAKQRASELEQTVRKARDKSKGSHVTAPHLNGSANPIAQIRPDVESQIELMVKAGKTDDEIKAALGGGR